MKVWSRIAALYVGCAVVFLAIDLAWLGWISVQFYQTHLGPMLREDPLLLPALVFYLLYVGGILVFAVLPALREGSASIASLRGAFLGLVAYGAFDLTSHSVFHGFPVTVVVVDLLWGTVLTCSVSTAGYLLGRTLSVETSLWRNRSGELR
ncbi:MAG: DUF2177 family protein [Longimicrobiales bacterium]|nr:DUF2177 family protein [Longimicrobiales bacterium]